MREIATFRNDDLVLLVTQSVNPAVFDITRYGNFLDGLCTSREYQKAAIQTVCNYLAGQAYRDQEDIAERNWKANAVLRDKYPTFERFKEKLPFPDRLACSIDHATGTGKSFVLYGLARILLNEGLVDRVLVLCPSNTIESTLLDKFRAMSSDAELTSLLPPGNGTRNVHIITATETITPGDICIENIHATYKRTKSSIDDSLTGKGARTLVLNDEAHHIYSPTDRGLKKWKEFLADPKFGFKYIVGASGTCYIDDEYFPDVVARYALAKAIEDGVVKSVHYVAEDSRGDQNEKFQKVYDNHQENKQTYRKVRPLTILVTKDIAACKKLTDDLSAFLAKKEKSNVAEAMKKVLIVTSDSDHTDNVRRLRSGEPDSEESPIEWITSVSMLTEGWDVQNVFQIVPHEQRAFNSKLLISQVLGRGLRVPAIYQGARSKVTVFNHDNWSGSIKHLVHEVLEFENRIYSFPVTKPGTDYNFELHHIDYDKAEDAVATTKVSDYNFSMDKVALATQAKVVPKETTYEEATTGKRYTKRTDIEFEMFPVELVVNEVFNKFKARDLEEGTNYAKTYSKEQLRRLIRNSLDAIDYSGDELSKENRQRILSSFGNLYRPGSKSLRYRITPKTVVKLSTLSRPKDSISLSSLKRGASAFFDDLSLQLDADVKQTLNELIEEGELGPKPLAKVANQYNFKTPLLVALASADPERRFIKALTDQENALKITAWVKSTDTGFYEIEYSYSKGEYSKRAKFNSDFFIKIGNDILVVEIKDDDALREPSAQNKGKRRAAVKHFETLNSLQSEAKYHFVFLTPQDFDLFFASIREGKHMNFQSSMDVALQQPEQPAEP